MWASSFWAWYDKDLTEDKSYLKAYPEKLKPVYNADPPASAGQSADAILGQRVNFFFKKWAFYFHLITYFSILN